MAAYNTELWYWRPSGYNFTENDSWNKTILQHTNDVMEGPTTRLDMDTGRSLQISIQECYILASTEQLFLFLDGTRWSALKNEILRLKKV